MGFLRNLKKVVYSILIIIIIFLFGIEIFSRIFLIKKLEKSPHPKFRFNSYRVYEHNPGFKEGKDYRMVINDNGFRRSENVSKSKPVNTFRVFLLGGSAAHGISSSAPYPIRHISNSETIDACLERILLGKYPDYNIEVINAAVTGYQVFLHTQYILSELLDYDPDLIIFFDGANDHYTNNPEYNYYSDFIYQFWKDRIQSPAMGGVLDYCFLYLSRYSAFARGYFEWRQQKNAMKNYRYRYMRKVYGNKEQLIFEYKKASKKQFLRSIELNLLILKHYNIDAIVCLQPMLVLRNKELLSQQEKLFLDIHKDEAVEMLYPFVRDDILLLTKKHRGVFVDMVLVFNSYADKNKQLFIDYCHLSQNGSLLVAETLLPEVEKVFKKRLILMEQ